ncbi:unnamed protein product [Effrenium voratum]|nr:unnamed protein product [Effrenium voratum]
MIVSSPFETVALPQIPLREALVLFADARTRRLLSAVTCNAAISACEKRREWKLSVALLEATWHLALRPTEVTYNAATSACEKAGRWRHALRLLGREVLDVVAFGAAIGACENATAWRPGLALLGELRLESLGPSLVASNGALSACDKARAWRHVLALLADVQVHLQPKTGKDGKGGCGREAFVACYGWSCASNACT